jgi:hypothetical protein
MTTKASDLPKLSRISWKTVEFFFKSVIIELVKLQIRRRDDLFDSTQTYLTVTGAFDDSQI